MSPSGLTSNPLTGSQFWAVAQEIEELVNPIPIEFTESRRSNRQFKTLAVFVQPLDENMMEEGEPFWAVSRDINHMGIGLICYSVIEAPFVRLSLLKDSICIEGKVRHNTSVGHQFPLFLTGVEFLEAQK